MVGTFARCCAVGLVLVALCGCTRTVHGAARGAAGGGSPARPVVLADVLIAPQRFPGDYRAAVLGPAEVKRAIRELDAVRPGAVVTPPECAPPAPGRSPGDAVAVQGTDPATDSALTVVVSRADAVLRTRLDQVTGCPSFTATTGALSTSVTTTLLPAPPVDAEDSYAVQQTASDPAGDSRRSVALVGQIEDVRVTAAWTSTSPDAEPDTNNLDSLFTDAVLKVRRGLHP